jgi:hypothetical protein
MGIGHSQAIALAVWPFHVKVMRSNHSMHRPVMLAVRQLA